MSANTLDLARNLALSLLEERDEEQRCIDMAYVMMILATVVEGTDACCPMLNVASDILHQARTNIEMWRADEARREEEGRIVRAGGMVNL